MFRVVSAERFDVGKKEIEREWSLHDLVDHLEVLDFWSEVTLAREAYQERESERRESEVDDEIGQSSDLPDIPDHFHRG